MKLKHFFRNNLTANIGIVAMCLYLSACAITAPVQEMSNARQTLRAAHQVKAQQYAPELFDKAENLLKAAENDGATILPLILKLSRFSKNKKLSVFQSVNDPDQPLSRLSEDEQDEVLVKLTDRVAELM